MVNTFGGYAVNMIGTSAAGVACQQMAETAANTFQWSYNAVTLTPTYMNCPAVAG
jgi:hypothetical protein